LTALSEHTALLPKIKLSQPKGIIGKTTQESILTGVVYGYSLLVDSLLLKLKKILKLKTKAIATGGDSRWLKKYAKNIDIFDPYLTLKGINLLNAND